MLLVVGFLVDSFTAILQNNLHTLAATVPSSLALGGPVSRNVVAQPLLGDFSKKKAMACLGNPAC